MTPAADDPVETVERRGSVDDGGTLPAAQASSSPPGGSVAGNRELGEAVAGPTLVAAGKAALPQTVPPETGVGVVPLVVLLTGAGLIAVGMGVGLGRLRRLLF